VVYADFPIQEFDYIADPSALAAGTSLAVGLHPPSSQLHPCRAKPVPRRRNARARRAITRVVTSCLRFIASSMAREQKSDSLLIVTVIKRRDIARRYRGIGHIYFTCARMQT